MSLQVTVSLLLNPFSTEYILWERYPFYRLTDCELDFTMITSSAGSNYKYDITEFTTYSVVS
jgi:hypothetical protein